MQLPEFKSHFDNITTTMRLHDTLPFGLAFAGAMLLVISEEVIPATHAKGKSPLATFGVMVGLAIILVIYNLPEQRGKGSHNGK